jgi:hypothetical protein
MLYNQVHKSGSQVHKSERNIMAKRYARTISEIPKQVVDMVDSYMELNGLQSWSESALELIILGLITQQESIQWGGSVETQNELEAEYDDYYEQYPDMTWEEFLLEHFSPNTWSGS